MAIFTYCFGQVAQTLTQKNMENTGIKKQNEMELPAVLKLALEALESSKPTHGHYPEPVERHNNAINQVKMQLAKMS